MEYTYEISTHIGLTGNDVVSIVRSDGAVIPTDETNSDYQQYLAWLTEQPVPKTAK